MTQRSHYLSVIARNISVYRCWENILHIYCIFKTLKTTLPPINFHNCTKSLLWRGNGTHRWSHTYPIKWHPHSLYVCNTNFGRTTAQSRFYVHPKTVSLLILFLNKLSLLYAVQYKCQPTVLEILCFWRNIFAWANQSCWTKL